MSRPDVELRILILLSAFCCGASLNVGSRVFPAVFAALAGFALLAARK